MDERPRVGVGVIIIKDKKVLLGKRKNAHGNGSWSFPGGHLEFGESFEDCARRETKEETSITIKNVRKGTFTNDFFEREGKHYVTLVMIAEFSSGVARVMEPEKCEQWEWSSWNNLPEPLFLPIQNLLKEDFNPFNI
jgi:8-oxo-dGTP diphosphatase